MSEPLDEISNEHEPPKPKKSTFGCMEGCLVVVTVIMLFGIFAPGFFTERIKENLPKADGYPETASNISYYESFMHQLREYDIPADDFKAKFKEAISIGTLPTLPPFTDWKNDDPVVNIKRDVPLYIQRYCCKMPRHKGCDPWRSTPICKIDPTGKTDDSCFHSVSKGYYYECRYPNGGGIVAIYDTDNGRCYIHTNTH